MVSYLNFIIFAIVYVHDFHIIIRTPTPNEKACYASAPPLRDTVGLILTQVIITVYANKAGLYQQKLFIGGLLSYLRYLCLFAYSGVQHILCCVFALFVFALCILYCQYLWIVHSWLPLRVSLTSIYTLHCSNILNASNDIWPLHFSRSINLWGHFLGFREQFVIVHITATRKLFSSMRLNCWSIIV